MGKTVREALPDKGGLGMVRTCSKERLQLQSRGQIHFGPFASAAQALALGAAKGDIAYDWPKGFFKRV